MTLQLTQFELYCLPWHVLQSGGKMLTNLFGSCLIALRLARRIGDFVPTTGRTTACKQDIRITRFFTACVSYDNIL